jgi:uncharacterized protein
MQLNNMKNMYKYIAGAMIMFAIGASISFSQRETGEKKKHQIVFHLTSPDTAAYRSLVKQVRHLRERWPDAAVEVVAHNKGINLLVADKTNVQPEITALKKEGIVFSACENTLRSQKIDKSQIVKESGFVPAGVVRVAELQEMGWSYIKAGF